MANIAANLKYLRRKKNLTQQQFADIMEVKRSLIGAYEEDRAEPKYELLKKIASFFDLSMDEMANEVINDRWKPKEKGDGSSVRILSITVDKDDRENIELVPVKASAGYLNGYADPEYISELPRFSLPMFNQGSYRAFELKGDSMLPLQPGTVIIGEFVEDWFNLKPGLTYIIVSKSEGVVYKRVAHKFKGDKGLKLLSDNKVYEPFWVETEDILEIWAAKAFISTDFPEVNSEPSLENLTSMMAEMQRNIANLKADK
ncbi:MAG TPA: LexA family transcriptional regulator [Sphingobacteriaceae bacterium]|nr:LexA family transcriptional regulator [Sphingobacteriaceae bacterium]